MTLKKILVVEDNEDNRRILVYRLRKIGQFDIREAANGQQAIDAVRAERPDLIFMDLKMPVMDGWEATKRIREMNGGEIRLGAAEPSGAVFEILLPAAAG